MDQVLPKEWRKVFFFFFAVSRESMIIGLTFVIDGDTEVVENILESHLENGIYDYIDGFEEVDESNTDKDMTNLQGKHQ